MDLLALILSALMNGEVDSLDYRLLLTLIRRKLSGNARAESILNQFLKNNTAWEHPLQSELKKVDAGGDKDIVKAARAVIRPLDRGARKKISANPAKYRAKSSGAARVGMQPLDRGGRKKISARSPDDRAESLDREAYHLGFDDDLLTTERPEETLSILEAEPPQAAPEEQPELTLPVREEQPEPEQPKRQIHAEILGHPSTESLKLNNNYYLAFMVEDTEQNTGASIEFDESRLFQSGEDEVELAIHLTSRDFKVYTRGLQPLYVPRKGKSENKPVFEIRPKKKGPGEITANFYRQNNFIQSMTLTLAVEEPQGKTIIDVKGLVRPVEGAFAVQPRDISLMITEAGSGYHLTMVASVVADDDLGIEKDELVSLVNKAREVLKRIVNSKSGDTLVYQEGIDIPREINEQSLKDLASIGYDLYHMMFYGPKARLGTRNLGNWLRLLTRENVLKIQIVTQHFLIPWGILYVPDKYDENNIDPEMFLGLKHIIEFIPLQQNNQVPDNVIKSRPSLNVSLNVNTDIDLQKSMKLIDDQKSYWEQIRQRNSAQVVVRSKRDDILEALARGKTIDQILYFYCHAATNQQVGLDETYLKFSGGTQLTLGDLYRYETTEETLPGKPLVFINACESASLSPRFYEGFMPYFTSRGARGMIGTESEVPALFAATWARQFFNYFLQGNKSVGEIFLHLRREFFYNPDLNNLLGLLYALYCDADTHIEPGLQLS